MVNFPNTSHCAVFLKIILITILFNPPRRESTCCRFDIRSNPLLIVRNRANFPVSLNNAFIIYRTVLSAVLNMIYICMSVPVESNYFWASTLYDRMSRLFIWSSKSGRTSKFYNKSDFYAFALLLFRTIPWKHFLYWWNVDSIAGQISLSGNTSDKVTKRYKYRKKKDLVTHNIVLAKSDDTDEI